MRELSQQTDPQEMVKLYRQRIGQFLPVDSFVALSRRGLTGHAVKVTRASIWDADFDPWMNQGELPVYTTGLLCDLIASGEPAYLRNITIDPSDPAYEYLGDVKLVVAVPSYDNGEALNMFVMGMHDVDAFDPRDLPDAVWRTNLFGRATNMLVLKKERDLAYEHLDSELKVVADIQRSLLPKDLPEVPGLDLADHYQTSARAGGDYYDIFPLEGGKWGFLIADVCGHGQVARSGVTHQQIERDSIIALWCKTHLAHPAAGRRHLQVGQQYLAGLAEVDPDRYVQRAIQRRALTGPVSAEGGSQIGAGQRGSVAHSAGVLPIPRAVVSHVQTQGQAASTDAADQSIHPGSFEGACRDT